MGKKTLCDSYLKYKNTIVLRAGLIKQGFPRGPHIWSGNIGNITPSQPRNMLGRSGNSLGSFPYDPEVKRINEAPSPKPGICLRELVMVGGPGPWKSVSSVPENHTLPSTVDSSYQSVPRPLWAWWVKLLGYPVFPLCSSTVWWASFCVCAIVDCFYCLHRSNPHFLPLPPGSIVQDALLKKLLDPDIARLPHPSFYLFFLLLSQYMSFSTTGPCHSRMACCSTLVVYLRNSPGCNFAV